MTADQSSLLNAAKQGNPNAIAALINRALEPKGITTKVLLNNQCLSILLESVQTPDQAQSFQFVYKGLKSLGLTSINAVKVYGRHTGSDFPDWQQEFNLNGDIKPEIAETPEPAPIVVRPKVSVVRSAPTTTYPQKLATPSSKPKRTQSKLIVVSSIAALSVAGIAGLGGWVISSRSAQESAVKQATAVMNSIKPIEAHAALDALKADQKQVQDDQKKLQAEIDRLNSAPKLFAFNLPTVDSERAKAQTQLAALETTSQDLDQKVKGLEQLLPFVREAVDKFSALNSSLDVGMNYRECGQQVRELKVALDRLERQPGASEHPVYKELALAFKEYDFAYNVWEYYIESDETHNFISTASPYGVTLMSEYGVAPRTIGDDTYIYLNAALSAVWQRASKHVDLAQKST